MSAPISDWMLLGWGTVGGAHLSHTWRYHPRNGLLQSTCRTVLRYGNAMELLHHETEQRCKICLKQSHKNTC